MRPSSPGGVSAAPSSPILDATVRVHPFRFDTSVAIDVSLLRWPAEAARREELARLGMPRVLVLGPTDPPPAGWNELEDWVRTPVDPAVPIDRADLVVRATTVARRGDLCQRPWLDGNGVVGFRERWCTVPEGQAAVVGLLVERFGAVVRDGEIVGLYANGRTSAHAEAVKTSIRRVKNGVAPLGLRLSRVRGAGYLLDRAE